MPEYDSTVEYHEIPGFPGYKVGSDGTVWSQWRGRKMGLEWRQKKTPPDVKGRPRVGISRGRKFFNFKVCTLILSSFVGPQPVGMECCHENDIKSDNRLTNLRWDTARANLADAIRNRKRVIILDESDIPAIRFLRRLGWRLLDIGRLFGVGSEAIGKVTRRVNWRHV